MISTKGEATRSITFRVPERIVNELETQATIENLSTNVLVKHVFENYLEFHRNAGKAGLIAFPRELLVRLMGGYTEKEVIAMAEYIAKDTITDIMILLRNEFTTGSFLNVVESWSNASNIPFRHETKGQLNTCIMQHDLSKNWSLYLGHLFKNVIEELAQRKVAIQITRHSVMFRF